MKTEAETMREAAARIRKQTEASIAYSLSETPRILSNVPTLMEMSLGHFFDIADDIERALPLRADAPAPAPAPTDEQIVEAMAAEICLLIDCEDDKGGCTCMRVAQCALAAAKPLIRQQMESRHD